MGCASSPLGSSPAWRGCPRRGRRNAWVEFEQYQRHNVWDQPGGLANRSGAGDLDVVTYVARKWARLAQAGNPTVLLLLFMPDTEVLYRNEAGAEHRQRTPVRLPPGREPLPRVPAGAAGSDDRRRGGADQPARAGCRARYDTKYAMHALRLGLQGVELLTTGRISLPGEVPLREVVGAVARAEQELLALQSSSAVPREPDRSWVDGWLHRA